MNEYSKPIFDAVWEPVTTIVFYEPRTIPAAWDLSELLPGDNRSKFQNLISKDERET